MEESTTQILVSGLVFPESPRWHQGKLWFSDIYGSKVYTVDDSGHLEEVVRVRGWPSGLGFLSDGRALVVSMRARKIHTIKPGAPGTPAGLDTYADLSDLIGIDPNDMVVDGKDRVYVDKAGAYTLFGGPRMPGYVVLITPDGRIRIVADGLANPNGLVVTPDGNTLIVAETFGNRLSGYTINADGSLSGHHVWANLNEVSADGICMDAEGGVWVGSSGGFLRVLQGGKVTDRIRVPGRSAVAPMLGGPDGRTLYMCTAQTTVYDLRRIRQGGVSIGWIETARVSVPRAGWP